MINPDEIAADQRHKDVLEAIGGLKGEIDRLEAQLAALAARIEARGQLIDKIASGLGIDVNAPLAGQGQLGEGWLRRGPGA
jgi:hypothetical protein